jgi:hypothetical protein
LASQLALQDPTQEVPMTSSSASFSAPVEFLPSTSVESSTSSGVSSDDHLNEIQRQYVANAMLMARSLSPEQLQKRTRQLSDRLSAIDILPKICGVVSRILSLSSVGRLD